MQCSGQTGQGGTQALDETQTLPMDKRVEWVGACRETALEDQTRILIASLASSIDGLGSIPVETGSVPLVLWSTHLMDH